MTKAFPSRSALLSFFLALSIVATWMSQSLLDSSLILVALLWFYQTLKQTGFRTAFNLNSSLKHVIPWMAAYFLVAVLGYFFNARPEAEPLFNLSRFTWVLQFLLLAYVVRDLDFKIKRPWFICIFLLFIPAVYGFNIYLNEGHVDFLSPTETYGRIIGLVNSATYHAHIGGFFFVICFAVFLFEALKAFRKKRIDNPCELIALGVLALAVLLSVIYAASRGALLATILAVVCFLFMKAKNYLIRLLLVVTMAFGIFMALNIRHAVSGERKQSDGCRVALMQVHLNMIKQYPWLGIGYRDNMRNISDYWPESIETSSICEAYKNSGSQAHNQYLNVAATTGILGLLCYLAFTLLLFFWNATWWWKTRSTVAAACLSLQLYFILSCMTEITFEFAKIRYLIIFVWAVVVNRDVIEKKLAT